MVRQCNSKAVLAHRCAVHLMFARPGGCKQGDYCAGVPSKATALGHGRCHKTPGLSVMVCNPKPLALLPAYHNLQVLLWPPLTAPCPHPPHLLQSTCPAFASPCIPQTWRLRLRQLTLTLGPQRQLAHTRAQASQTSSAEHGASRTDPAAHSGRQPHHHHPLGTRHPNAASNCLRPTA